MHLCSQHTHLHARHLVDVLQHHLYTGASMQEPALQCHPSSYMFYICKLLCVQQLDGMALLEQVAAQHCGNVLGLRTSTAVSLLQSQLSASHFQAAEGAQNEAAAEAAAAEVSEAAEEAVSSGTPSQPETPMRGAAQHMGEAAQAAKAAAAAAQPSAAAFAASFAAAFAIAEPPMQEAGRGFEGGVGMRARERRSTQPEAPAATGGSRMVTFDLPPAGAQPPAQPSAEGSSLSASADEAAGGGVSSIKVKQSSSSSPATMTAAAAKKASVSAPAPHSTAAAKPRALRLVGKAAGLSPKGLVPGNTEQATQQQAAQAASVTVGRVCFPA
jgi:hypothetical protein